MIPTASDMGDAIWANTLKLLNAGVLEESSRTVASRLRSGLKKGRDSQTWDIRVPRDDGFVFSPLQNSLGTIYQPIVSVDGIVTDPASNDLFSKLDISLQIASADEDQHARWHFDMANRKKGGGYQPGPLFHLQFGGNSPGFPGFWLDLPRWAHAPMDLVLLLEAVAANFYPNQWSNELRDDATWCEWVSQSELLCLSGYVNRVAQLIGIRSKTVLGNLWANV